MNSTPVTLESLVARLSDGEPIDAAAIPADLRAHPEIARLLALSRVMNQLDANVGADVAPAATPSTAAAGDRLGPFRLERVLGSGGMGEVWLAERDDGEVRQRVAVKRVRGGDPRLGERLREERRILARLEHPNIARFIDAGFDAGGTPWLALEYVDGVAITEWCQARGRSAPRSSMRIVTSSYTETSSLPTSLSTPTASPSCSTSASRASSTAAWPRPRRPH